jgi:hypothetical protein
MTGLQTLAHPDFSSGKRVETRSHLCIIVERPDLPGMPVTLCIDDARHVKTTALRSPAFWAGVLDC